MMRRNGSRMFAVGLLVLGLAWSAAQAEEQAERLLQASHDYVADHSCSIQQTIEQTAVLLIKGKPAGAPQTTKQVSTIEIDVEHGLVRVRSQEANGKPLLALRKGSRVVVKVGSDPWMLPSGPYAQLSEQLANPFACPLPEPGNARAPQWQVVGPEQLDGQVTTVIETIGDSAHAYAEERIRAGLMKVFPNPAARPTLEILGYKSRHWIAKGEPRRVQVEQTSHEKLVMPAPAQAVLDLTTKTTAVYRQYGQVTLEVPQEARRLLDPS